MDILVASVMTGTADEARMLGGLLDASHLAAMEQLPALLAEHAAMCGLDEARVFVVDLRQQVLRELTGRGLDAGEGGAEFPVDGSLPGQSYRQLRFVRVEVDARATRYWAPILDGTERLGVLRVTVSAPGHGVEETISHLASLMAHLLVSKRMFSDSYTRLQRLRAMNVAAEMQWSLMPPMNFANDEVAIAAVMEPAYEVAGDAFDYAVAGDVVHMAMFDAMGHDVAAGLTANLAVAACRCHRRQDRDLLTVAEQIEETLLQQFGHDRFATAVLADLDTANGILTWTNRGHLPPVLIRGKRHATTLSCPPAHPLGTDLGLDAHLAREQLEPGDRLLLYTDGITEARDRQGNLFGLERFVDYIVRHQADGMPVPETLRRLMRAVLDHHDSHLNDDATVLFLEWHGPSRNLRMQAGDGAAQL